MEAGLEVGRRGEELALEWLLQKGFILRERNWRWGHKEIDLIVETRSSLHIVEVKTLLSGIPEEPQQRVDRRKIRHLAQAADHYVRRNRITKEVRFDVVAVRILPDGARISYIPEAFYPFFS